MDVREEFIKQATKLQPGQTSITSPKVTATDWIVGTLMVLGGLVALVGLAFGLTILFKDIAAEGYHNHIEAPLLVHPGNLAFGFMATLLSVLIVGLASTLLTPLVYSEERLTQEVGDDWKKMWWIGLVTFGAGIPFVLALSILFIDEYTVFTDEEMIENSYWSLGAETRRPHETVTGIYEVLIGTHNDDSDDRRPLLYVRYRDGSHWKTPAPDPDWNAEVRKKVAKLVSLAAGVPIEQVRYVEDVPEE